MKTDTADSLATDNRLGEVLAACLEAVDRGETDPQLFIDRYPDFAVQLTELFAAQVGIERITSPLRQAVLAGQPVGQSGPADAALPDALGDFRIVREIGRGGMGIVYEAEQLSLRRRVAFKVLPFAAVADPRHLKRFHNEALAAAGLDHPHVVRVYAVGSDRGVHYIAMQYIDGRSLADVIRERRGEPTSTTRADLPPGGQDPTQTHVPNVAVVTTLNVALSPTAGPASRTPTDTAFARRVAEWGIQAAEALEHAHSLGIVHRDVKPANLLVDGQGELFVADFGLAKLGPDPNVTVTGDLLGTPRYMSPEQAAAKHGLVDHRSDVYSLGASLYELLTLTPAFDGTDRLDVLRKIAAEEPTSPRKLDRKVPRDLETVVLKAIEKDPNDRYQSAMALADDFRRFLRDEAVTARRSTLLQRARKWGRRHRSLVWSLASVLVITSLVVAAAIGWEARDQAARRLLVEQAVDEALGESHHWQQDGKLPEALSAARRAKAVAVGGPTSAALLQRSLDRVADLELLDRLENLLVENGGAGRVGRSDDEVLDDRFAQVFQDVGLKVEGLDEKVAGDHIRQTTVAAELAAVLDHWAYVRKAVRPNDPAWKHFLRVASSADPDPFRARIRESVENSDPRVLQEMVKTKLEESLQLPPQTLRVVGAELVKPLRNHLNPEPLSTTFANELRSIEAFLREAQRRYPNDFWLNQNLTRFYLRRTLNRGDEAYPYAMLCVALRPGSYDAHNCLGLAFAAMKHPDQALAEYREAIRIRKDVWQPHFNGGLVLLDHLHHWDEAVAELEEAIRLEPRYDLSYQSLGIAYALRGQWEKAAPLYKRAYDLNPDNHRCWQWSGMAFYMAGDLDGYRRACRGAMPRFAKTNDSGVAVTIANLCLLTPDGGGELGPAVRLAREGVPVPEKGQMYGEFGHLILALAEYRDGHFSDALRHLEPIYSAEPTPALPGCTIAGSFIQSMAYHRLGRPSDAQAAFNRGRDLRKSIEDNARTEQNRDLVFPGSVGNKWYWRNWHDWVIIHSLHREAEQLLAAKE